MSANTSVTHLLVEGEVRDVDDARALEDGLWYPHDVTSVAHHSKRLSVFFESIVGAVTQADVLNVS